MTEELQVSESPNNDERMWGMLCHLVVLFGCLILFTGNFLGLLVNVLGPFVIWMIKKNEMSFVNDQGKESLNFQLTMLLAFIASFVLMFILIGILIFWALIFFQIVVIIMASVKANDGIKYRYPFAIRFIK